MVSRNLVRGLEGDSKKAVKKEVAVIESYARIRAGAISGIGVGDRMASGDRTCI
jgi:hypothetical protein